MDEFTDIDQMVAELKKLRAEKAAANETTEAPKRNGDNADGEIDETDAWVEEPWDAKNLVDLTPKVDAIIKAKENSSVLQTIGDGSLTNDLDIPGNEPADNEENLGNGSEINDLDIPANQDKPSTIETDIGANDPIDKTYGCNIYNIPEGTTFMELAMLFVNSNVVNISLPNKDSAIGHVTFADWDSFLSIVGRTDRSLVDQHWTLDRII